MVHFLGFLRTNKSCFWLPREMSLNFIFYVAHIMMNKEWNPYNSSKCNFIIKAMLDSLHACY